jgi:hypothetical protein
MNPSFLPSWENATSRGRIHVGHNISVRNKVERAHSVARWNNVQQIGQRRQVSRACSPTQAKAIEATRRYSGYLSNFYILDHVGTINTRFRVAAVDNGNNVLMVERIVFHTQVPSSWTPTERGHRPSHGLAHVV